MPCIRMRTALTAMLVSSLFGATASFAAPPTFQVVITNLTGGPGGGLTTTVNALDGTGVPNSGGQVFTPILVASAKADVPLFALGQPASIPLQDIAESGSTASLKAALLANPDVLDVETTDLFGSPDLGPGQSVTVTVQTKGKFNHVIVAAMLVPTNDAFFAVNDVQGPTGRNSVTILSPAYDAGSKADDEICANIAGDVCTGSGFLTTPTGIGFVFISSGIHGVAGGVTTSDLDPRFFNWQNPVAQIVITRVP
jgi:hypothetical protein